MTEPNGTNEPADQPPQAMAPPPQYQYPNPGQVPGPGPGPYPNAPQAPYGGYGPYNPYGGGPYGYPQGYFVQPQGTNGMAIASLVLGICGFMCVTPFVGLALGITALSKIGKTGQSGKGMAIAGVILSSVWIALLIVAIVTGSFHFNFGTNSNNPGPSVVQTQGPNGTSA